MVLKTRPDQITMAMFLRKYRLVSRKCLSGGFTLNVKRSSPGNHMTLIVLTISSPSLSTVEH